MKLIVGLGNPGKEYQHTRHNSGFRVVDELHRRWEFPPSQEKFKALFSKGKAGGEDVILLEPLTFMNLSGDAVIEAVSFYKLDPASDLIVVHDEVDLPLGTVRLQKNISSAGHNGVKSIIERLGSQDFSRLRIGIGRPADQTPVEDYVVQPFRDDERAIVDESIKKAADEIEKTIKG